MKKVKRIEVVPLEDLPKAKVIMSLANLWAVDVGKGKTKYEGDDLKFAYLDDKTSEVVSKKFRGMVFSIRAFKDGFSDTNLLPVKIHYHDGSWEYGLKWWEDRDIVYQRNRRLVSLFVKSGYVNDHNEEIEDAADTDRDSRIPAWILDLLPRYNEKIRDAVNGLPTDFPMDVPLDDWSAVHSVIESGYVTEHTQYSEVKLKKRKFKAPVGLSFSRNLPWQAILTTWKDNVCVNEFGIQKSKMLDQTQMVVTVYSYLKSIYANIHRHRKVYKLIPLGDLLFVSKEKYERDEECPSGYCVDDEVWNNLDQTVAGNV